MGQYQTQEARYPISAFRVETIFRLSQLKNLIY